MSSQYLLVRAYRLPSFLCLKQIELSSRGKAESKAERTQDKTHSIVVSEGLRLDCANIGGSFLDLLTCYETYNQSERGI